MIKINFIKNKKRKSKGILFLISVLLVLPIFLPFIQGEFGYKIDNIENYDQGILRSSSVYYRDTDGYGYDIFISGDYAYIADEWNGLVVIDISDPTTPGTPICKPTDGGAWGIYVSGNYAFIADDTSGLAVIDISDPTAPGDPDYLDTDGYAEAVYVEGNYAYIADEWNGLVVIDISDPTTPGPAYHMDTDGIAWDVYVSGNYAYLAVGSNGLAVIDISNPTNPGTPDYMDTAGNAENVYVEGNYAYVACYESGLAVIDISDPTNPGSPVYEDTYNYYQDVHIEGNYAYTAHYYGPLGHGGLGVIDISNPTNPQAIAYRELDGMAEALFIDGNYGFISGRFGLAVVKISEPTTSGTQYYRDTSGSSKGVFLSGDYAYVADGTSGLAVIDISDPINPGTPHYSNTAGTATDVYVSGDYAYIADGAGGLAVIDISDPTNPGTPHRRDTSGNSRGIYVSGDYAFIADDTSGLAVIDISDPTNPGTPVYTDPGYYTTAVYVDGDYAYLSGGAGIITIDISDPTTPGTHVYKQLDGGSARDIYVKGNYAYLATYNTIEIADISNPIDPQKVSSKVIFHCSPEGIFVSGDYAYTAENKGSLGGSITMWDISNPNNPIYYDYKYLVGVASCGAFGIIVSGDYAYVAQSDLGLGVFKWHKRSDISDPVITASPSDKVVEMGYTGETFSWRATDANPDIYTIELQGTGIVAGPTGWSSGSLVTYNIPDGLSVGEYYYTITFTDDHGFYAADTVKLTVQDTENPVITESSADLKVLEGYTGQTFAWTATDANPNTYTIFNGSIIVAGPTSWSSGVTVTYDIPDGLSLGDYFYTINFTDDYEHFTTDTVKLTVYEPDDPVITDNPLDLLVSPVYTGVNFSWTATDANPDTYTIELTGTGIVAGPTGWSSGVAIIYNVPNGIKAGEYYYTINFTDVSNNYVTDTVKLTIQDTDPQITNIPDDMVILLGYTGEDLSWTATDAEDPNMYTIELAGSGIVAGPTSWSSGVAVTYDIPEGLSLGDYFYTINFTDETGNYVTDEVKITVQEDAIDPIITYAPEDYGCFSGYTNECLFWIATDAHPATFTVEHEGHGIVVGPTSWTSGNNVSYTIPEGLSVGEHFFTINFTDLAGNFATDTVKITIQEENPVELPPAIPFGNFFLTFMTISIIGLILIQKRKK
ncbi:MAG: hypothetical protein ACTSR7_13280 [Promethearchaeota archaeon]